MIEQFQIVLIWEFKVIFLNDKLHASDMPKFHFRTMLAQVTSI